MDIIKDMLSKFGDKLLYSLILVVFGIAGILLGATGGNILWVPANTIQGYWRTLLALLGGILILIGIFIGWKAMYTDPNGELKSSDDNLSGDKDHSTNFKLSITQPFPQTNNFQFSIMNSHTENIIFAGIVEPFAPNIEVWVLRQNISYVEVKSGKRVAQGYIHAYKADIDPTGKWENEIRFLIGSNSQKTTFKVWAVIPTLETKLLLDLYWAARQALGEAQNVIEEAKITTDWVRPWLPISINVIPSSIVSTENEAKEIILKRK